jgi:hypothetical protein
LARISDHPNGLDRSFGATIYPVLDKRDNSGGSGGLKGLALLQISPPVIQVFLVIRPAGKKKKFPNNTHYVSWSVVGVELIAL